MWKGSERIYPFTIEYSVDGKTWETALPKTQNTGESSEFEKNNKKGGEKMAKQGMRRERFGDIHGTRKTEDRMPKNEMEPVSEIQGKAKKTKQKANPIIK